MRKNDFGGIKKYENIDLKNFMSQIVDEHVAFYKEDLKYDFQILDDIAGISENTNSRWLLWLVRTCGTHCLKLSDVLVDKTIANTTWRYYAEQENNSKYLAFAIEITRKDGDSIIGNAYEIHYLKSYTFIVVNAVPGNTYILYESGELLQSDLRHFDSSYVESTYGKFKGCESRAEDQPKYERLLSQICSELKSLSAGNLNKRLMQIKKENLMFETH